MDIYPRLLSLSLSSKIFVSISGSVVCFNPPCAPLSIALRKADQEIAHLDVASDDTFSFHDLLPGHYKVSEGVYRSLSLKRLF